MNCSIQHCNVVSNGLRLSNLTCLKSKLMELVRNVFHVRILLKQITGKKRFEMLFLKRNSVWSKFSRVLFKKIEKRVEFVLCEKSVHGQRVVFGSLGNRRNVCVYLFTRRKKVRVTFAVVF